MADILQLAREAGAQVDTFSSSGKVFIDFTPDQLSAFRDAVLEEAAKRCDQINDESGGGFEPFAEAIRGMKGQP